MNKIKNIVFDIGNVLFAYNPGKIIDTLIPNTQRKEFYLNALFLSPLWTKLDRGDLTPQEAIDFLSHEVDHHPIAIRDLNLLLDHFAYHLDLIFETQDLFLELSETFPLYILSNFQDEPFDKLVSRNSFLRKAKGAVVSGKVQCMKPEPEIYAHLLHSYALNPKETLFIDDLEANIEACRAVGMKGIVFQSPSQLKRQLTDFNIAVRS